LNEAVALDLLAAAGLASQRAAPAGFRVNDGPPALRLAIEHPNDAWMAAYFSADGLLYKCEATGDWTYRGDDPDAYDDIFDLEGGGSGDDAADIAPLAGFLDFLNNSDDATFAAELPERLDLDRFAVYRAMMDLIANFDDIGGPGNNGYLFYDPATERFTIAPWDMNLAFVGLGDGAIRAFPDGGPPPVRIERPDLPAPDGSGTPTAGDVVPANGQPDPGGPVMIGGRHEPNPLVERFDAVDRFAALVDERSSRLRADLYDGGTAESILARWVGALERGASELVDQATIESESAAIAEHFKRPE
jgi:spore coat protein CotH